MKKVKLQILAQDILETTYLSCKDCAITRALHRAGLPFEDAGTTINYQKNNRPVPIKEIDHQKLTNKILAMYGTKDNKDYNGTLGKKDISVGRLPIEDFTHTLTFLELN